MKGPKVKGEKPIFSQIETWEAAERLGKGDVARNIYFSIGNE